MIKYKQIIKTYHSDLKEFNSIITKLTVNVKNDVEGRLTERSQFSSRLYDLLESIQYRLGSVEWHLKNLCQQHSYYEKRIEKEGIGNSSWNDHQALCYLFDDFIFNLISLYDYFGSYIYISFIDQNKQKKTWNKLSKAAGDKNHDFSNCLLAKEIFKHHREWVSKLNDYRAETIHYKLNCGGAKKSISIDNVNGTMKTELMCSIPDNLVKLLNLENCKRNKTGVDLQFGAIEIAKQSMKSLKEIAELALTKCTTNSIIFKEK